MASLPQPLNLLIYRGDSYRWQFTLWADGAETVPVDLTGVTVAAELRQATTIPLACSVTANTIDVVLSAAASQTLAITNGAWDLQLTYPSGEVKTIIGGHVSLRADVTGAVAS